MANTTDVEQLVRTRLRALRSTLGLSLDELAGRTNLSASTISRIETGKRTISLDVLIPLAAALGVDIDALVADRSDEVVVIRPTPDVAGHHTTWLLSRPDAARVAMKMRIEPTERRPEQRVHPGHDWFLVISGRVRLLLGDRVIAVGEGEAAEFTTMTPHAIEADGGPAEVLMVFDRDGQRAHLQHSA